MEIPTRYSVTIFLHIVDICLFFLPTWDFCNGLQNSVDAFDAILQKWNIPHKRDNNDGESWNINSTNPCKGFVVDDSNDKRVDEFSDDGKLEILCLCDKNSSTCNIIKLAAWDLNISGTIPDEIQNLTKLVYLDLASNNFYVQFLGNLKKYQNTVSIKLINKIVFEITF